MRANGAPSFPDPGSSGKLPSPSSPAFAAAKSTCAKLQPTGLHLSGPAPPTRAELRAALQFARCIRAHGLSRFPDPLTAYGPGFTLGRGEYFPVIAPGEVTSPAFKRAAKDCGLNLP